MGKVFLQRAGQTVVAVWALASLVFLLSRWAPPPDESLGLANAADLSSGAPASVQARNLARQAARQRLGLAEPLFYFSRPPRALGGGLAPWQWNGFHNQYHRWLVATLRGDWGTSFRDGQPVAVRLGAALACTIPLTGAAAALSLWLALALALALARRPWWQGPALALLAGLQALPLFILATGLLLSLANPDALDWFPTYAQTTGGTGGYALGPYLILPLACLVLSALPDLTLQMTASLTHELDTGYAITARAKGLAKSQVLRHHTLRNALVPILPLVADLLPALVAGAVVVEVVFSLPGMGRLLAEAAATRDYPVLVGGVLLVGAARLFALVLADAGARWLDPRVA
ncbi:ABC transporter permease subunit [Hymenobacter nivis]|uniref:ABC transporter permease subunit n=1 Tax=Hymenobacter nivis TaxID=1850093 RepID=UPI0013A5AA61|nr:ABC transporter permease [Hymenobacter nivis]